MPEWRDAKKHPKRPRRGPNQGGRKRSARAKSTFRKATDAEIQEAQELALTPLGERELRRFTDWMRRAREGRLGEDVLVAKRKAAVRARRMMLKRYLAKRWDKFEAHCHPEDPANYRGKHSDGLQKIRTAAKWTGILFVREGVRIIIKGIFGA